MLARPDPSQQPTRALKVKKREIADKTDILKRRNHIKRLHNIALVRTARSTPPHSFALAETKIADETRKK